MPLLNSSALHRSDYSTVGSIWIQPIVGNSAKLVALDVTSCNDNAASSDSSVPEFF